MLSQTSRHEIDSATIEQIRAAAADASHRAYAPYSRYFVGAALLLTSGEIVTGCNVENVSYRLTCCAEQAAVARAVSQFGPTIRIAALAVANADSNLACQPCGACRQTIAEFANGNCPIFYPGSGGKPGECTLADLLPAAFTPESIA